MLYNEAVELGKVCGTQLSQSAWFKSDRTGEVEVHICAARVKIDAYKTHAYEMHAHEMHAHTMRVYGMQVYEMHFFRCRPLRDMPVRDT